jgi:IPT/TIG domain
VTSIASFTPSSGTAGDVVTVTGTGFIGATNVQFDGGQAATYTIDSDTLMTVTVPRGATTGPISVTGPAGAATSTKGFVVKHVRSMSKLVLRGTHMTGTVASVDRLDACGSAVPLKVQRLVKKAWHKVSAVQTRANGSFRASGIVDPGKYRVVAAKVLLDSGDVCLRGYSPIAKMG